MDRKNLYINIDYYPFMDKVAYVQVEQRNAAVDENLTKHGMNGGESE